MEHIERSHPLRVSLREVVVHCNDMHSLACQGIEEHRESCHEGLTLTCRHLGDLSLMENDTTDELYIIMDHVPGHLVTAGKPMVLPYGIVTFYGHEFLCRAEVTVKLSRLHSDSLVLGKSAGCRLHDRECLRKDLIEHFLDNLVDLLHELVLLCRKSFLLLERNVFLEFFLYLSDTVLICSYGCLYLVLEALASCSEGVIIKEIDLLIRLEHLVQGRPDGFHITVRLGTE